MKVLQINSVCGVGSTGRIAANIYHLLISQGHQCKVAYGRNRAMGIHPTDAVKIGSELDVRIHGMASRITDKSGFYSTSATKKFIEQIKEYDPDIIHLHNIHGYYINIKLLFNYLKSAKKPVVWTLHDCWPFTGHCAYFDLLNCNKWEKGCHHCLGKSSYPQSLLADSSKSNYTIKKELFCGIENLTIVTPSKWLADLVSRSFLSQYETIVIHNGIDLSVFKPTLGDFREKYALQGKTIVLGVASVWDRRKGLDDLIKLSQQLDDSYKVVIVGITEKQKQALPQNVLGITRTDSASQLAEIYTAADVFVNPTYEDNFPTTNLEALACGTPVVTYNTGGSPESVSPKCGIVAKDKSVNALVDAIQQCKGITADNCIDASKDYDATTKNQEYTSLYKRMLNEDC